MIPQTEQEKLEQQYQLLLRRIDEKKKELNHLEKVLLEVLDKIKKCKD